MMEQQHIELLNNDVQIKSRKNLLPLWIKIFVWIFLVLGAMVPIALIFGLLGKSFQLAIYGLETNEPFSTIGITTLLIFSLKAIVAFGLWTEKNWAIKLAIIDALIGVIICSYIMIIAPILSTEKGFTFNFRLELTALIPYLILLFKLKKKW